MSSIQPLLLDTHVWVNYLNASPILRKTTVQAIEDARSGGVVFVSTISIWEIALLVKLKRLSLNTSVTDWIHQALQLPGVKLISLSPPIAIDAVDLPDPMHKDPCDRILVASARVQGLMLVTRDKDILNFAKTIHLPVLKA